MYNGGFYIGVRLLYSQEILCNVEYVVVDEITLLSARQMLEVTNSCSELTFHGTNLVETCTESVFSSVLNVVL